MTEWLRKHGQLGAGTGSHHNHGGATDDTHMPGMATPEQLSRLGAAAGAEFDRLFLQLMIAHHEGALTMATQVLSEGRDVFVEEMARGSARRRRPTR